METKPILAMDGLTQTVVKSKEVRDNGTQTEACPKPGRRQLWLKRFEEIKKKHWCAYCEKREALLQFHCCWNHSYCSYFCKSEASFDHNQFCPRTVQDLVVIE
jgi:hypothetical protein